jgi:hypothetical protein
MSSSPGAEVWSPHTEYASAPASAVGRSPEVTVVVGNGCGVCLKVRALSSGDASPLTARPASLQCSAEPNWNRYPLPLLLAKPATRLMVVARMTAPNK